MKSQAAALESGRPVILGADLAYICDDAASLQCAAVRAAIWQSYIRYNDVAVQHGPLPGLDLSHEKSLTH